MFGITGLVYDYTYIYNCEVAQFSVNSATASLITHAAFTPPMNENDSVDSKISCWLTTMIVAPNL